MKEVCFSVYLQRNKNNQANWGQGVLSLIIYLKDKQKVHYSFYSSNKINLSNAPAHFSAFVDWTCDQF